jgi:hypothetical protein
MSAFEQGQATTSSVQVQPLWAAFLGCWQGGIIDVPAQPAGAKHAGSLILDFRQASRVISPAVSVVKWPPLWIHPRAARHPGQRSKPVGLSVCLSVPGCPSESASIGTWNPSNDSRSWTWAAQQACLSDCLSVCPTHISQPRLGVAAGDGLSVKCEQRWEHVPGQNAQSCCRIDRTHRERHRAAAAQSVSIQGMFAS